MLAIATLVFAACGKPTAFDACQKVAASVCAQRSGCDKSIEKSGCEVAEQLALDCAHADDCGFADAVTQVCFDDLAHASCAGGTPVSCGVSRLCPASTSCDGFDVSDGTSGCTVTLIGARGGPCSDGHTYGAHCAGPMSCDCQKDGVATGTTFNTQVGLCQSSDQAGALKNGCGWDF